MLNLFLRSELACPTTPEVRLATGICEALERLRVELDAPIYLTSACRSPKHNAKVGGHPRNLHSIINGHLGIGRFYAVAAVAAAVVMFVRAPDCRQFAPITHDHRAPSSTNN